MASLCEFKFIAHPTWVIRIAYILTLGFRLGFRVWMVGRLKVLS